MQIILNELIFPVSDGSLVCCPVSGQELYPAT